MTMVKQLTKWQCETCGKKYETKSQAKKCEAKIPAVYPVGCMYATHNFSVNDTYAVAENRINNHQNNGSSWDSRDEDADHKLVGHNHTFQNGSGQLILGQSDKHADPDLPSCKRMIEWLESQGITPTIWDGEKAISLKEGRKTMKKRWRYSNGNGTHPRGN